jgi:hypothetical protein
MKEPAKSKPRRSKKLVVDRIVGGKIMRAKREGSIIKLGRKRSNPSLDASSPQSQTQSQEALHISGALTQKLGKSSTRNLKLLRSTSKNKDLSTVILPVTIQLEKTFENFELVANKKLLNQNASIE